jgi:hypothetical protein
MVVYTTPRRCLHGDLDPLEQVRAIRSACASGGVDALRADRLRRCVGYATREEALDALRAYR